MSNSCLTFQGHLSFSSRALIKTILCFFKTLLFSIFITYMSLSWKKMMTMANNLFTLNITECPICSEDFKPQKLLPCSHSYCIDCLEKLEGKIFYTHIFYQCTIPVPVIVLYLCHTLVSTLNSTELHFQGIAPRSQYSDPTPEAVMLQ